MVNQVLLGIEEKMKVSLRVLKEELATVRTGHASPALIEHVKVDYGGTLMALNQIAGISAPEAGLLVVHPWDKGAMKVIEKAILTSGLGLNPIDDGSVIRISIPPLSEERRQELIKVVRKRVEERRVALRNLRHEAMDGLKGLEKEKEISQDEHKRGLDQLQKITDGFIAEVERMGRDKETELMEV